MHCSGIEPESQEWESCMIPLHQQCCLQVAPQNVFMPLGHVTSVYIHTHTWFGWASNW